MSGASDAHANPEMLFAAGYSACFDSALNLLIENSKIKTGETSVIAKVSIGQIESGGFGLSAELSVNIPEISLEKAQELVDQTHQVCPYSVATSGNMQVKLNVTNS
jgi:Ohr subfamily peroxiredoxin